VDAGSTDDRDSRVHTERHGSLVAMPHNGKQGRRPGEAITLTATQAIRWVAITTGEVLSDVGLVVLCVSIPWTNGVLTCRQKLAASATLSFRLV